MKKRMLLVLFVFLFAALPVSAQTDELIGTWIGFFGPDFRVIRFSADGSLSALDTMDVFYTEYTGTYQTDGGTILFDISDGNQEKMTFSFEEGKLILDWYGEWTCTRIDDSDFPDDPEASPYIGENRKYRIAMAEDGGIQIFEYFGNDETVEVPGTAFGIQVTEIAESAICYQEEMKHLILPDGLKSIAPRAFEEDHVLEDVILPNTLETIGYNAFQYCYSLKEITIPEGVKVLEADTFWQCDGLQSVTLAESLEEIDPEAFHDTSAIVFSVKEGSYAEQVCQENGWTCISVDAEAWEQKMQG